MNAAILQLGCKDSCIARSMSWGSYRSWCGSGSRHGVWSQSWYWANYGYRYISRSGNWSRSWCGSRYFSRCNSI